MPIQVQCSHCKAGFQAKDEHVGKRAKCPKCGQVLVIGGTSAPAAGARKPAAGAAASGQAAGRAPSAAPAQPEPAAHASGPAARTCPSCGAAMAENAILCIACGYNVSTGQKLGRAPSAGASDEGHKALAPSTCSACGASMAPGTAVCLSCGVDNRALESDLRSRRRPRKSGPTRLHYIALAVVMVLFVLVGVQCTRMLLYDYGAQFASLINEHKSLAKFDASLKLKTEAEQAKVPNFPQKVLVCGEDGQILRGLTDPNSLPFLPRNPSEVRTILFVRQTDMKVQIASGLAPVVVPEGAGVPTVPAIRVACQICIVDCASKSVIGDDTIYVDPVGAADTTDVTASGGRGPVGLRLAEWVKIHAPPSAGQ